MFRRRIVDIYVRYKERNDIIKLKILDILNQLENQSISVYQKYKDETENIIFSKNTWYWYLKENLNMKYVTIKTRDRSYFSRTNEEIMKVFFNNFWI